MHPYTPPIYPSPIIHFFFLEGEQSGTEEPTQRVSHSIHFSIVSHNPIERNEMIIPIRCFTCGKVIGNKWDTYLSLLQADYTEGLGSCAPWVLFSLSRDALDALGLR